MSWSKPLPPFTFDLLCYLNRDQLERFSIVCRPLKNFIGRYFQAKPYRIFDYLHIREGSYALFHNWVQWHPNREDYSVQQFLASQKCNSVDHSLLTQYYSFAVMHPYLGPIVRINNIIILTGDDIIYNPEHVAEMESIANLWRDGNIQFFRLHRICAEDFLPILNSPTILQCRKLIMNNAHFSFKDYKVLYTVNVIVSFYFAKEESDPSYWTEFLEQPGVKPIVVLEYSRHKDTVNALECFKKTFSSAIVPNAFKIVFPFVEESLTGFRKTNMTSREILELKKELLTNCENIDANDYVGDWCYILKRSSI